METLQLGELAVELVRKDIKHVHLSVHPPMGHVRIAAPQRMRLDTVRVFAAAKLGWIRLQQRKVQAQPREPLSELVDRESHWLWGRRLLLVVVEQGAAASVSATHRQLLMRVRPGTSRLAREALLDAWYRDQLRGALRPLLDRWSALMGVGVSRVFVQRMKTRWGSCSPATRTLRLNTELARKPIECLEFVLVHEMAHLLEPDHGRRFVDLMDALLPHWRQLRDRLNCLPLPQAAWTL